MEKFEKKRKKYITKTIRLADSDFKLLEMVAEHRKVTFNALMNHLIFLAINGTLPTEETNGITISRNTLRKILNAISIDECEKIGIEIAKKYSEYYKYLFNLNPILEDMINFIEIKCGVCSHWFRYYSRVEGKTQYIYLTHNLGENWSSFLRGFMMTIFKMTLDLDIIIVFTNDEVIIKFNKSEFVSLFKPVIS